MQLCQLVGCELRIWPMEGEISEYLQMNPRLKMMTTVATQDFVNWLPQLVNERGEPAASYR